jgi:hypothetical protein
MGAIDTSVTFNSNDVLTSTNLNNILDQSYITSDAIAGTTLAVDGNKLRVRAAGITPNELAPSAVLEPNIQDASISTVKIKDAAITPVKIEDGAILESKIAANAVTNGKVANSSIGAAKLDGQQTGVAPIYGARAFCKIAPYPNGVRGQNGFKSGNYNANSITNIVTVTISNHNLKANDRVRLIFTKTSGAGVVPSSATFFTVIAATDANTFTVAFTSTGSSGTVVAEFIQILNASNVSSASFYDNGTGRYLINFAQPMPNEHYSSCITGQYYVGVWNTIANEDTLGETTINTSQSCHIYASIPQRVISIVVFG